MSESVQSGYGHNVLDLARKAEREKLLGAITTPGTDSDERLELTREVLSLREGDNDLKIGQVWRLYGRVMEETGRRVKVYDADDPAVKGEQTLGRYVPTDEAINAQGNGNTVGHLAVHNLVAEPSEQQQTEPESDLANPASHDVVFVEPAYLEDLDEPDATA